jgi:cell division protein FtsI/penicillin-binding protein 2
LLENSHKAAAALALKTDGKILYEALLRYGLIRSDANATKLLKRYSNDIVRRVLGNGYSILVTPMRLLRAYAIFANEGYLPQTHQTNSQPVMRKETAKRVSDMLIERWRHFRVGRDLVNVCIGVQTAKSHKIYKGHYVRNIDQVAYGFVVTPDGDAFVVGVILIDPKKGTVSENRVIELFTDTIRVLLKSE